MKKVMRFSLVICILLVFSLIFLSSCNDRWPGTGPGIDLAAGSRKPEAPGDDLQNNIVNIAADTNLYYVLPEPETDGDVSVETALTIRRSHRSFQDKAISTEQLSQLLWASYGISSPEPGTPGWRQGTLRTAPSAGATYPLVVYAVTGNVEGIEPGVYRYDPDEHKIEQIMAGDIREELGKITFSSTNGTMISDAPVTVFYCAVFERTTGRYGERGRNYVFIELGHSAQNVYLQAEALGLGTCAIGAFTDDDAHKLLGLPSNEEPLYLLPVGYIK